MRLFDDLVIVTEKQFYTKLNYIHENPVRKGLVKEAVDWKWSSARFWMNDEEHPVLKKDWDWGFP
jgi:putative transposase